MDNWRISKSIGMRPTWLTQGLKGPLGNRRTEVGKPTGWLRQELRVVNCFELLMGSACYRSMDQILLTIIGTIITWLTQGLKGPLGNRHARVGCPTR